MDLLFYYQLFTIYSSYMIQDESLFNFTLFFNIKNSIRVIFTNQIRAGRLLSELKNSDGI